MDPFLSHDSAMKPHRILCIGNRYVPGDDAGPRIFDRLARMPLPHDVCVIDGGLMGLNLLKYIEGAKKVVLVDSLKGFAPAGRIVVKSLADMALDAPGYGHDSALQYLLALLPGVCKTGLPSIFVVGVEGPIEEETSRQMADLCLALAEAES